MNVQVLQARRTRPCCICRFRIQVGQHMIRWRGAYAHTICVVTRNATTGGQLT